MSSYKSSESFSLISQMPVEARCYIAGMIDADGMVSVSINRSKRLRNGQVAAPSPMVIVTNSDFALIEWLKETIGFGCSYFTKTKPTRPDQHESNWSAVHRFQLTGSPAALLCRHISQHMIVKQEKARLVGSMYCKGLDFKTVLTLEQRQHNFEVAAQIRDMNNRSNNRSLLTADEIRAMA